jgi:hypothetical protein
MLIKACSIRKEVRLVFILGWAIGIDPTEPVET